MATTASGTASTETLLMTVPEIEPIPTVCACAMPLLQRATADTKPMTGRTMRHIQICINISPVKIEHTSRTRVQTRTHNRTRRFSGEGRRAGWLTSEVLGGQDIGDVADDGPALDRWYLGLCDCGNRP
jgi:hypothetical protein